MEHAKDQNNLNPNKGINPVITFAILLVSFSVFYYLVIFLPQQNKQQMQQQIQLESFDTYKQITNQQKLETCLNEVNQRFKDMTLPTDKMRNVSAAEANVILNAVFKQLEQSKNECYKKFPQ